MIDVILDLFIELQLRSPNVAWPVNEGSLVSVYLGCVLNRTAWLDRQQIALLTLRSPGADRQEAESLPRR